MPRKLSKQSFGKLSGLAVQEWTWERDGSYADDSQLSGEKTGLEHVGFTVLLLIVFGGVTDRLIPLFAIGAFLAFLPSRFPRPAWSSTGSDRVVEAHLKPAPEVMKLIADWKDKGRGLREIARELNRLGNRTPRGFQWYASTVKNQLLTTSGILSFPDFTLSAIARAN
jgi:hypothetical protein